MRIALIAPLMEAVPPRAYGGTERVVASLAEALSAKGHQVTVFANGESRVNAELVVCRDRSLLTDDRLTEGMADQILMLDRVRRMADRFNILHFHTEFLHFPMFEGIAGKTVTTCHSRLDYVGHPRFFDRYRGFPSFRYPMHSDGRFPMPTGRRRSITATRGTCSGIVRASPETGRAAISPSSGGSPRTRGSTPRSRSRAARGCR
ncbi:glycosyltransferase [Roseicyclus sp.]